MPSAMTEAVSATASLRSFELCQRATNAWTRRVSRRRRPRCRPPAVPTRRSSREAAPAAAPQSKSDSNAARQERTEVVSDDDDGPSATDATRPGWPLHAAFLRDERTDVRRLRDRRPHLLLGCGQVGLLGALQGAARAVRYSLSRSR